MSEEYVCEEINPRNVDMVSYKDEMESNAHETIITAYATVCFRDSSTTEFNRTFVVSKADYFNAEYNQQINKMRENAREDIRQVVLDAMTNFSRFK